MKRAVRYKLYDAIAWAFVTALVFIPLMLMLRQIP